MKKTENKETGEVSFSFTGQEIKKLKSAPLRRLSYSRQASALAVIPRIL